MTTTGERIEHHRTRLMLSQTQLAAAMKAAGHPAWFQQTVARTEQGERPLRLDEAVSLAGILQITLHMLAGVPDPEDTLPGLHAALALISQEIEESTKPKGSS